MSNTLSFYKADTAYCDYLRKYDYRVPYTMDNKATRPFIGVLIKVNDISYYAPLSSPKPKHLTMKNQLDFLRINSGNWGAINFNNMIPISSECLTKINPNEFISNDDEKAYKNLLENQLSWCNENKDSIIKTAQRLYNIVTAKRAKQNLLARCCDFGLLEQKCKEYIQAQDKTQNQSQSLADKINAAKKKANEHNANRPQTLHTHNKEQNK